MQYTRHVYHEANALVIIISTDVLIYHLSLCGGYIEILRDLRVIYEQKLVKMAFHQELVGKILSSSYMYVTCQKVVTYSIALGGTRHSSAQVPRPYGTVQNGRETFAEWPTRGWLVCRLQVPHKLVVSHSRTRMSLGTDVSQSQVKPIRQGS